MMQTVRLAAVGGALMAMAVISVALFVLLAARTVRPGRIDAGGGRIDVSREVLAEAVAYHFVDHDTGESLASLQGSTDLVCDSPSYYVWDFDSDGLRELYWMSCGRRCMYEIEGPPAFRWRCRRIRDGQPVDGGLMFQEVYRGGTTLLPASAVLFGVGLVIFLGGGWLWLRRLTA